MKKVIEGKSLLEGNLSPWLKLEEFVESTHVMAEDLTSLCGKLLLTEKENQGLVIDREDVEDTIARGKYYLVGKVISEKPFHFEVFCTTVMKIYMEGIGIYNICRCGL